MKGKIVVDPALCKGCGLCVEACPNNLLVLGEDLNEKGYHFAVFLEEKDGKGCVACTLCAVTCPEVAIEVYREEG